MLFKIDEHKVEIKKYEKECREIELPFYLIEMNMGSYGVTTTYRAFTDKGRCQITENIFYGKYTYTIEQTSNIISRSYFVEDEETDATFDIIKKEEFEQVKAKVLQIIEI